MIESGTEMGIYQIDIPCIECDGWGYHEIQIAADDFKERICEDCWGEGKRPVTEFQADED